MNCEFTGFVFPKVNLSFDCLNIADPDQRTEEGGMVYNNVDVSVHHLGISWKRRFDGGVLGCDLKLCIFNLVIRRCHYCRFIDQHFWH